MRFVNPSSFVKYARFTPTAGSSPPLPGNSDHADVVEKFPNGYDGLLVSPQSQNNRLR